MKKKIIKISRNGFNNLVALENVFKIPSLKKRNIFKKVHDWFGKIYPKYCGPKVLEKYLLKSTFIVQIYLEKYFFFKIYETPMVSKNIFKMLTFVIPKNISLDEYAY